jgi:hypothetical protein
MSSIIINRNYTGKTNKRIMKQDYRDCMEEIDQLLQQDAYSDNDYCYQLGARFTDDTIEFTYIPESILDRIIRDIGTICGNYCVIWFDGTIWHNA